MGQIKLTKGFVQLVLEVSSWQLKEFFGCICFLKNRFDSLIADLSACSNALDL